MEFNRYKVVRVEEETEDTKTFYYDPTSVNGEFVAGQYITVSAQINGEEVRRSYSLCTAPHEELRGFSVKRVTNGLMSNFLHDNIKEGDDLILSNAEGRFVVNADEAKQRDHYFIAAGSGITPVLSMVKTVLENEPLSTCYLLYGSRSENNIIFHKAFDYLMEKYQDQLIVTHTLSQPIKEKKSGFSGLLGKSTIKWTGEVGRIDEPKIRVFLAEHPSKSGNNLYYLCGPGDMINKAEKYLSDNGISKDTILKEFFAVTVDVEQKGEEGNVKIILDRKEYTVQVKERETILDAAFREKIDAPYSCTSGACSSCMAKVVEGEVVMDVCLALEDDEVEEGYILTCQSKLKSSSAVITYDV